MGKAKLTATQIRSVGAGNIGVLGPKKRHKRICYGG